MALVGKKPYPKATIKKIIKAHSNLNIKKNADISVRSDALLAATESRHSSHVSRSSLITFYSWIRKYFARIDINAKLLLTTRQLS
jgi:hypothetical protein